MVKVLTTLVKPLRTYCNVQDFTFSFDLDLLSQGHQVIFFKSLAGIEYIVKILAKSVKPLMTYH